MNIRYEIENLNEVMDGLISEEDLKRAVGRACLLVERKAKEKAPKGNGALRGSITSEVTVITGEVIGDVFTPLEYAPYVEYGTGLFAEKGGRKDVPWHYQDDEGEWHTTSGQHPQPFMRPALNESREEILRIIKEAIND